MTCRVSIILPALNESAQIGAAIDLAVRAGADEIIVVDGGSQDGTREIAADRGSRVLSSEAGRAKQQNAGAAVAGGDLLLFQHADCRLSSDCLKQVRIACTDSSVSFGAFEQQINANGWLYGLLSKGNAARVRMLGLAYGDQGIFVRREAFEQVGGFPDEPLMEDVVLMRRLRRLGRPRLLPGPLQVSARRWEQKGVLTQTVRNWCLLSAFFCGVSPRRLQRYYPRHDAS